MSNLYTNTKDTTISICNNPNITKVDLENNEVLQNLVIYNCSKLECIRLRGIKNLTVRISDCPKLLCIYNDARKSDYAEYSKSLYLGKGLINLELLYLRNIETLMVENQYLNIKRVWLYYINCILFKLNNLINLEILHITKCNILSVNTTSDKLEDILISGCYCNNLSVNGRCNKLQKLTLTDNNLEQIFFKYSLNNLSMLDISQEYKIFPYFPLVNKNIDIYLDSKTNYHIFIKKFMIYNNLCFFNRDDEDEIINVKFYVPSLTF